MLPRGAALLALVLALLGSHPAAAQIRLPRPTGYVNDFAEVIPAEQEAAIDAVVQEVRARSGGEIAVVTLPSLQGRPVDQVALQVLRDWGVGGTARGSQPGDTLANTGAVVLVAPRERRAYVATGYGANTFITAGEAGRILDQYMVPHFRANDYGTGTLEGVRAVAQQYAGRFGFRLTGQVPGGAAPRVPQAPAQRPVSGGGGFGRLLFYVILAVFFFSFFRGGGGGGGGRRRRRYGGPVILPFPMGGGWGGGGGFGGGGFGGGGFGGGGFGGFGGGSGGGGGAGRGW